MSGRKYEKLDAADGSESDDDYADKVVPRTSEDVRRHDHETLTAEEEAERLLGRQDERRSRLGNLFKRDGDAQTTRSSRRKKRSKGNQDEKKELMYEMEEGGPRLSGAESSASSSETDLQRLGEIQARRKKGRGRRFCGIALVHFVIVAAFLALLYGAYQATTSRPKGSTLNPKTLSNGTHSFAPTTILLSLDGFRADFLTRGITPTLNDFIRSGVSPKYMMPSFPSLTFPNHFTLVTGLHPESHGVVGNTFWDPNTQKEFYYTDPARSMQPEWWDAEPIWVTAESNNVRTAIHMWPGSEAHIGDLEPEYVDKFNAHEVLDRKVQRILTWLDMPGRDDLADDEDRQTRPQLIAAYVPNVDADGHKYGPNSTYIRSTIAEVDGMLADLFKGIGERNLTNVVNIIVVSDHGMATTSTQRLIQLEDIVDTKLIEHIDGWPLYGLRPYKNDDAHIIEIYNDLFAKSKLAKYKDSFDVYLRDKNMPDRWNFRNNDRIAPLWIVPRAGWAIVAKDEWDVAKMKKNDDIYHPRGLHGYDHEDPLMRAIFVARGPAFPHPEGSRVHEFQNTEVYNIVCDSIGLEPKANNGTLRLPFKTKGKHDFDAEPDVPFDPPADDSDVDNGDGLAHEVPNLNKPPSRPPMPSPDDTTQLGPIEPFQPLPPTPPAAPVRPQNPDSPDGVDRPVIHDEDKAPENVDDFWAWVKNKIGDLKWWASETFGWKKEQEETEGAKKEASLNKTAS